MSLDMVIKNGTVIDPANDIHGKMDIGIRDGKITRIEEEIHSEATIFDAEGLVVVPGCIDMHVHCSKLLGSETGFHMVARTGITTVVDFAGPAEEILETVSECGFGLNVAVLETVQPNQTDGRNPSAVHIQSTLDSALANGAVGLKLLGGHFPLTPEASARTIEIANRNRVMIAFHAGTTKNRSDINGMREAIELSEGRPLLIPHINAYCRGNVFPYQEELHAAFTMLRENRNIVSDSHLATMNAAHGMCRNGIPADAISVRCLEMYGYEATETGLMQAIRDGLVSVIEKGEKGNFLVNGEAAVEYWERQNSNAIISFPVNLAAANVACALERVKPNGDYLISMTSTDGGGIPRNNLIGRMLHLYHLGYLSLEDVIRKISVNPARNFGFTNKGHLSPGADADITIIDLEKSRAVTSFVKGSVIMKDGICHGSRGTILLTDQGIGAAEKCGLDFDVVDPSTSEMYRTAGIS